MNQCTNCGAAITDDDLIIWKCPECGKKYKIKMSKVRNIKKQKDKSENAGQFFVKCKNCGKFMDDGSEELLFECHICSKVLKGNLDSFFFDDTNENIVEIKRKFEALKVLFEKGILSFEEFEECKEVIQNKKVLSENGDNNIYDTNEVVWDNKYIKVIYKEVIKRSGYIVLKMLVENKTHKSLSVYARNISINNFIVEKDTNIVYGLLGHKKIIEEASVEFDKILELGIYDIEQIDSFQLNLFCEIDNKKTISSTDISLRYPVEKRKNKIKHHFYIDKIGQNVLENEYVKIVYLGIITGGNYWGINLSIENRSKFDLTIETNNVEINDYIVDVYPNIVYDLPPNKKKINYISLPFDKMNQLLIKKIDEMKNIKLTLFCKRGSEMIDESPLIILHAVDWFKEKYNEMCKIVNEVNEGVIWHKLDLKNITFEFPYPNGKHGDIDMYLISKYGDFKQVSPILYQATISTEYLHIIEMMILFYYTSFSQNALLVKRNNNEALNFLRDYNNIMKLNDLYSIVQSGMERKDRLNDLMIQKAYNIIHDKYLELKFERNDIYAEIAATKGTSSKWKSEQQLYAFIKNMYPDAIYQYQAEWLGKQSLDIFIPSLSIGIEYQGRQHYEPIEYFGGEEGYKETRERDKRKKESCKLNKVTLLEWNYQNEVTHSSVNKFLMDNIE